MTIRWSTPRINTGCDGKVITRYRVSYTQSDSTEYNQVDVEPDQSVMVKIDGLVNSTEYRYFVISVDDTNGRRDARSSTEFFTTQDELDSESATGVCVCGYSVYVVHVSMSLCAYIKCSA